MPSLLRNARPAILAGFGALTLFILPPRLWSAEPPAVAPTVYVCPPCAGDCDSLTFDRPGTCPHCGMALVPQERSHAKTVAILLFNGVQIIDYSGPWEVFGEAGYRVFTVAQTATAVKTVFGQSVVPTYTFATAPHADILVVPGGDVGDDLCNDQLLIRWIQGEAATSEHVLSVCTGAFLLAKAGLLDGLSATTYHGAIDRLAHDAPRTKVVRDKRFVDNGKIIVTAGLSSGIDGALHLVSVIDTLGVAQGVALNAEYNWQPDSGYARAALADRYITFKAAGLRRVPLAQSGDRWSWKDTWRVDGERSVSAFTAKAERILSAQPGWTNSAPSQWTFQDPEGRIWQARSSVMESPNQKSSVVWTLEIREGSKWPAMLPSAP